MDRLADELWATCVNRRAANDDETNERWQTDEVAHLTVGFYIENMHDQPKNGKPMSAYIQPHLDILYRVVVKTWWDT